MLECCKNLAKPNISISRDGLVIKAWYEDYPEDFLKIKGEFGRDIFENGLLTDYMRYGFHKESCTKQVQINRIIIQAILTDVTNK